MKQQRITISNLQEALIAAKHELEEFKQRNSQEVSVSGWAARWLGTSTPTKPPTNDSKAVHDV